MIIDIYDHFCRSAKRKSAVQEYIKFTNLQMYP